MEAAASALVEHLGRALRCGWVSFWKSQSASATLRVLSTWHSPSTQTAELEDFTGRWQPSAGEGKVGEAWRSLRPQYSGNVIQDMALPRSLLATRAGLFNGLWMPIPAGKAVFVLEFLWSSKSGTGLPALLGTLPEEIAAFVERRKP